MLNKSFKYLIYSSMILVSLSSVGSSVVHAESKTQKYDESTSQIEKTTTEASKESTDKDSTVSSSSSNAETTESSTNVENVKKEIAGQTFHIQKVISDQEIENGESSVGHQGVDGSHFTVYDVTDLFKQIAKQNKTNSVSDVQKELIERSNKLDLSTLKKEAEGTTATVNNKTGVFEFSTKPTTEAHQAFYVVNDSVPEETATLSDSFVIITPVSEDNGDVMKDVWIYPKSKAVEPTKEVKKIVSTGGKEHFFHKVERIILGLF